MATADLDGRKLGYARRGSGEPLLLVPGMAMHHGVWSEPLLSALERDFDVIAMDHRGVADSDDVPGNFTVADLASDALALLDALGIDSVHLFGFSLGGMVAQEIVLQHPGRVRTLVLGGTYCGGEGSDLNAPGPLSMLQAMQTGDVDVALRAAFAANLSAAYVADESHYEPFMQVSLAERVQVPTIVAQARAAFFHNTHDRLAEITAPTLVIHGTDDQMIVYSNGQLIAKLVPDATLHTFDATGHLFFWEHPDESATLIREHCLG